MRLLEYQAKELFKEFGIKTPPSISSKDIEKGMIDIEGSWIPLQFVNQSKQNKIKLSIENWNPNKKKKLS